MYQNSSEKSEHYLGSSVRCCFVEPRNSIVWKWEKTLYNIIIIIMIAIRCKTQPLLLSAICCNHEEGHWEVVADMRGGDHVVGKKYNFHFGTR